jgi:hypothetical protein
MLTSVKVNSRFLIVSGCRSGRAGELVDPGLTLDLRIRELETTRGTEWYSDENQTQLIECPETATAWIDSLVAVQHEIEHGPL